VHKGKAGLLKKLLNCCGEAVPEIVAGAVLFSEAVQFLSLFCVSLNYFFHFHILLNHHAIPFNGFGKLHMILLKNFFMPDIIPEKGIPGVDCKV
jgi:hypothetical protein